MREDIRFGLKLLWKEKAFAATALLALVALGASLVPSLRAVRIRPAVALRDE